MAVGQIANEAKVPVMIMNAATASITRGSPYYVRTSDTIPQWAATMGQWAAANGVKTAYILVTDYAPGYDAETYFAKAFKQNGGEIIGSAHADPGNQLRRLHGTGAAGQARRALHVPAGRLAVDRLRQGVRRTGPQTGGIRLLGGGEFAELYLPNFSDDVIGVNSVNHYTETNTLR